MEVSTLKRINNELLRLQFCPKLSGYKYLRDSVAILLGDRRLFNLKKDVYPLLSAKYKVSPQCIDKCINTVIEKSFLNISTTLLEDELEYLVSADKGKPTVKQLIMYLYEKVG